MIALSRTLLPTGCALLGIGIAGILGAQDEASDSGFDWSSSRPQAVLSPLQIVRAIHWQTTRAERHSIRRDSSSQSLRGPESARVYRAIAPSIVYVTDGESGHGTGFFVLPGGWILTNHHVIDDMPFDPATGYRMARIVTGQLADDGAMSAQDGFETAVVYRSDERCDLALLRIDTSGGPSTSPDLPALALAEQAPVPGTLCIAIGHPAEGVLWTLRQGEVAGRGEFPRDQIGNYFIRGADSGLQHALAEVMDNLPSRKVLLSSCGLNPGDSGGPLVDETGRLVAVSFAIPAIDPDRGIDLGKFSYHIHLDEVRAFLADLPETPEVRPPAILPAALIQTLADLDKDGRPETWVMGVDPEEPPTGLFVDLDSDSDDDFIRRADTEGPGRETPLTAWDWEVAFVREPREMVMFETTGDRQPDLIAVHERDGSWVRFLPADDGSWRAEPWGGDFTTEPFFDSDQLNRAFRRFLRRLR